MARTKWEGLWTHKGQYGTFYSGYTIKKKDIPPYTRLVIRHNKYWKKDNDKPTPRYVYCFMDATGHEEYCRPIEFDEGNSSPYIAKTVIITHLTESVFIQKKTQDELLTERLMTSNTGYPTLMIFCQRILFRMSHDEQNVSKANQNTQYKNHI